jgi:hypothetical protein
MRAPGQAEQYDLRGRHVAVGKPAADIVGMRERMGILIFA